MLTVIVVAVAIVLIRGFVHRTGKRVTHEALRPGAHRARDQRASQGVRYGR